MTNRLERRQFLRSAGTAVALPMLDWFRSRDVLGETIPAPARGAAKAQRLVCIGAYLGLHCPALYPKATGLNYETTPILAPLERHRGKFTLFSGLDHRAVNGHSYWSNYLCGVNHVDTSLDQLVAGQIGSAARFDSLVLHCGADDGGPMCFSQPGVPVPPINRPSVLYAKMFGTPGDLARTEYLLQSRKSSLDRVTADAQRLMSRVGAADRAKLDEYFSSLRAVETRLGRQLGRLHEPPPKTDYRVPAIDPIETDKMLECERVMLDLTALALQTDSSRVVSLRIPGLNETFVIDGQPIRYNYHAMSHHGMDHDKTSELVKVDTEHMRLFAGFLDQLHTKTDADGRPLLDSTIAMWGTGMGDASRHSNDNLPTLVAGGGFKHRGHLAFSRTSSAATDMLLGDLFITIQRQLGIDCREFSNAMHGIDSHLA